MTLIAHPAVLRDLIAEYEALTAVPDKANSAWTTSRTRCACPPASVTSTLPWLPPSTSRRAPALRATRC